MVTNFLRPGWTSRKTILGDRFREEMVLPFVAVVVLGYHFADVVYLALGKEEEGGRRGRVM
jgi:hypothetical protein